MRISEIMEKLKEYEQKVGDVPIRVWFYDREDDETYQIKDCFLSDFSVRHVRKDFSSFNRDCDCVVLEIQHGNENDTESVLYL